MTLKSLILAISLIAGSVAAHAAVFDLGVLPLAPALPANGVAVVLPSPAPFMDWWAFSMPAHGSLTSFASTSILLDGFSDLLGLSLGVYASIDASAAIYSSPDEQLSNVVLKSGESYFLRVTGQTTGTHGGAYSVLASVAPASPVPEADTLAMFGLGLGVLGWAARRRKTGGHAPARDALSGDAAIKGVAIA